MSNFRRIGEPFKVLGGVNGRLGGNRPGTGSAFVPTDLAGLRLWLDGDDIDTLYQDTLYTVPITANGQSVAAWQDKSGNAHHVIQANAANRPTYRTAIQNNKPIIRFDGNDYLARASAVSTATRGSLYAVFILRALTNQDVLFSISVAAAATQFSMFMPYYGPNPNNRIAIRMRNAANDRVIRGSTVIANNTPCIHEWHSTGAIYNFFVNAINQTEVPIAGANDGAWHSIIAGANTTTVGARQSAGVFNDIQADICELILYDGDMTAYYADIRNYLNNKWAIY